MASIGPGLLVLLAVAHDDTEADADRLADRVRALRVFDENYGDIVPSGGLPAGFPNPLVPAPLSETMSLLEEAVDKHDGGLLRVFPAPSNPSRCSDDLLVQCEELARRRGLGVHTHLLETEIQTRIAQERYGMTMVPERRRSGPPAGTPPRCCRPPRWAAAPAPAWARTRPVGTRRTGPGGWDGRR